jgi:hypothetical protein
VSLLDSSAQKMASVSASQRLSSGSWVRMCHVVCHPEGHVSLNIIEKLSLNTKYSPRLEPTTFGFVTLIPVISPNRTNFALALFFVVLSFRATGNAVTGNRTQDTFP